MKKYSLILVCLLCLVLTGCDKKENTAYDVINNIYNFGRLECIENGTPYGLIMTTTDKTTQNTASYELHIDEVGNVKIYTKNSVASGTAYYINGKGYLKLTSEATGIVKEQVDSVNKELFYNMPVLNIDSLANLDIPVDTEFKEITTSGDTDIMSYYQADIDSVGTVMLSIDKATNLLQSVQVNGDKDVLRIEFFAPDTVILPIDIDDYEKVDTETFNGDMQDLKLNGIYCKGILTMNNTNIMTISADIVNAVTETTGDK